MLLSDSSESLARANGNSFSGGTKVLLTSSRRMSLAFAAPTSRASGSGPLPPTILTGSLCLHLFCDNVVEIIFLISRLYFIMSRLQHLLVNTMQKTEINGYRRPVPKTLPSRSRELQCLFWVRLITSCQHFVFLTENDIWFIFSYFPQSCLPASNMC